MAKRHDMRSTYLNHLRPPNALGISDAVSREVQRRATAVTAAQDEAAMSLIQRGVAAERLTFWRNYDTLECGVAVDLDPLADYMTNPACTIRMQADGTAKTEWHEPWSVAS